MNGEQAREKLTYEHPYVVFSSVAASVGELFKVLLLLGGVVFIPIGSVSLGVQGAIEGGGSGVRGGLIGVAIGAISGAIEGIEAGIGGGIAMIAMAGGIHYVAAALVGGFLFPKLTFWGSKLILAIAIVLPIPLLLLIGILFVILLENRFLQILAEQGVITLVGVATGGAGAVVGEATVAARAAGAGVEAATTGTRAAEAGARAAEAAERTATTEQAAGAASAGERTVGEKSKTPEKSEYPREPMEKMKEELLEHVPEETFKEEEPEEQEFEEQLEEALGGGQLKKIQRGLEEIPEADV